MIPNMVLLLSHFSWVEGYHLSSQAPVESLDHLCPYHGGHEPTQGEHEPYHPNKVPFLWLTPAVHAVTLLFTLCWLKKMRKMPCNRSSVCPAAAVRAE